MNLGRPAKPNACDNYLGSQIGRQLVPQSFQQRNDPISDRRNAGAERKSSRK